MLRIKAGTMPCCKECSGNKKDCEPNPLHCIDLRIANGLIQSDMVEEVTE